MATLKELRDERIKKLNKLQEIGFIPFQPDSKKEYENKKITNNYDDFEDKNVYLAGRIKSLRKHGKVIFADLEDFSGVIQLYIKEDTIEETSVEKQFLGFDHLDLLDVGDFVQTYGKVTKTQTGEISLLVSNLKLLTKSIRPLPDKHEGLKDPEVIFRRRYLDMVANPEVREMFIRKSKFWRYTREFLNEKGFIEIEVPIMEHVTGGADAKPFITHHEALDEDFYLRISSELYQKRVIGGGFEKIYVLGPNFRNEGIDDEHLQEYYQLEWYWAYANYKDNMTLTRDLYRYVAEKVYQTTKFTKDGYTFDLSNDWEEIDYTEIIKKTFGVDIFNDTDEKMLKILQDKDVKLPGKINRIRLIDNLWKLIRKDLSGPAFLINQPKFISPLAKLHLDKPELTQRFQIIIAGSEQGNGYSELNNPFEQLERFREQQEARDSGDEEAQMLDIDFVEMLEYGMPPTSGFGMSERLFWSLEGVTAREGTMFPQMRRKIDDTTKEIYNLKSQAAKNNSGVELPLEICNFNLEDAEKLLNLLVEEPYQKLHAKMVAQAMSEIAKSLNEDENLWYITGLLHDIDYFKYPNEHPFAAAKWFETWNFPEEFIQAVLSHAHKITNVEPKSKLDCALMSVDELAGFLYAYSLMRPEGFVDMEAKSVKKKFKDKAFARKVDREDINIGIEKFGVDFIDHVNFLISVFQKMKEFNYGCAYAESRRKC